jgi:hypothetical protein
VNLALLEKTKKSMLKSQFHMADWCQCIAAHVVHARSGVWPLIRTSGTGVRAARYLGITTEEADRLFYLCNWPSKFQNCTLSDSHNAVARIDWFIKTKGTDKRAVAKKPELLRAA